MEFKRTRYVASISHQIEEKEKTKLWLITGEIGAGKKTFLHLLHDHFTENGEKSTILSFRPGEVLQDILDAFLEKKDESVILLIENTTSQSIADMLLGWQKEHKKEVLRIITNEDDQSVISSEGIEIFSLPRIAWREYRDEIGLASDTTTYKNDATLRKNLDDAFQTYLYRGAYPDSLASEADSFQIQAQRWERKYTDMVLQLYKKDEENFQNFLRTLALETGSLLKGDYFAKLVGIPRRKVWEFLDVLTEFGVIDRLQPYVQDMSLETSIHDRYYWTDLSYLRVLLGDMYMQGTIRQKVLENALYLELKFALTNDHILWFYRKKSQATIPFLLEHIPTEELIPITFTDRNTGIIPQVFHSFQSQYGDSVKRYIVFTSSLCTESILDEIPVLFLPHTLL